MTTGMKTVNGFESIKEIDFEVISHLRLEQILNWPNPLTQSTVFICQLSLPADVTIKIYTMAGKLIKTLKASSPGSYDYSLTWDGRDEDGDAVANGVYLYKIIAERRWKLLRG